MMRAWRHFAGLLIGIVFIARVTTTARAEGPSLAELKGALVSGAAQEQLSAMDALAKKGSQSIGVLCDVIENVADARAKERATQTLEKILERPASRDAATLERLGRLLASRDRKIVETAGRSLMHFKRNARVREMLKKSVRDADDDDTAAALLGAVMVAIDGDKTEAPYFAGMLKHRSPAIRIWAAGYLGALGSQEGAEECKHVLSLPPSTGKIRTLQMRAAIAAGRIGDPSLIPALERVGGSPDYDLASKEARTAIREIRLGMLKSADQRTAYLRDALVDDDSFAWGINHLRAIGDGPAVAALEWGAANGTEASRHAANRALDVMKANQK